MGQKVNPTLIRLGVPATNNSKYLNPITRKTLDLFDREDPHTFPAKSFGKSMGEILIIEKYLLEIFEKSGILVNNLRIRKSSSLYTIYLDIFERNKTSKSKQNSLLERKVQTRKIRWTARKLKWRKFTKEDADFYSDFFQEYFTNNTPVQWRIRYLNTDRDKSLRKNRPGRVFMEDGEEIFKIISKEPSARLLGNFIREELLDIQRHSLFIRYVFANLDLICLADNSKLKGCLVSIKGRVNGSDRSKKTLFRKGSVPLHTFDAAIDYFFTEVITRYGVCSIKVWLKYE